MAKVDEDSARLALIELAEAAGVAQPVLGEANAFYDWAIEANGKREIKAPTFLQIAMDARLFLKGGKIVYRLRVPVILGNGQKLEEMALRFPSQDDYDVYSKGLTIKTNRAGEVTVDASMMADVAKATIERLSAGTEPGDVSTWTGALGRMARADFRTLSEVCDALGFFE